jgi:MFS family permease
VPGLLRAREFRLFWLGQTVSLLGDQVSMLAIPLVGVLALHAGAAEMGYLTAIGLAPSLLFSLHAGVYLDRRGRHRQHMLAADAGRAVLLLSIPISWWLGGLTLWQLYGVAFATGSLDVLFYVAYLTFFVSITPPASYVEGQSLLNGSRAVTSMAGQSLAGVLVAVLTAPVALLVDASSFLTSAWFLSRIHAEEPPTAEPERGAVWAGVRFIVRTPVVLRALGATATVNFFNFVFFALFVLYAVRSLGVSPAVLGLVLGAGAAGAIIGSFVTGAVSRRIGVGPAFVVSCVLFPAPFLLVPAAPAHSGWTLVMLFGAEFLSGAGVMLLDITAGVLFAGLIPDALRARVSGAYRMVNYGVRPLGALVGGALGSSIGLRPTLWIAAAGGIGCVLWVLPSPLLRLRTVGEGVTGPTPDRDQAEAEPAVTSPAAPSRRS